VVHIDHGVGRYLGLQTLDIGGANTEFLTLNYANDDKLYVPVSSLHLISRYTGASEESAPMHRLGGEQWQKVKKRAAQKAHDVAAELLEIHARRAAKQGYAYKEETNNYSVFASGLRRCRLWQDRSRYARCLCCCRWRQTGGDTGTNHATGAPAPSELS